MGTSELSTGEPTAPAGRRWRRHSAEFKVRVIELARLPGVSTAAVANGLNANMLRHWVREAAQCVSSSAHKDAAVVPAFVQLPVPDEAPLTAPAPPMQAPNCISVEIRRGSTTVQAELPLDVRSAAWLCEVLG